MPSSIYVVTIVSLWADDIAGAFTMREEAEAAMQRFKVAPPKGHGTPIGLDLFRVRGETVERIVTWRHDDKLKSTPPNERELFP